MIDLIDVSKSYGKGLPAVNHVNLHVDKGGLQISCETLQSPCLLRE